MYNELLKYIKCSKHTARKAHNAGYKIYITPMYVSVHSEIIQPSEMLPEYDFDKFCNEVIHYQCCSKLGKRLSYYYLYDDEGAINAL